MQKVKKKKKKRSEKQQERCISRLCGVTVRSVDFVQSGPKTVFVYTSDMIDLDKPKTNWVAERGLVQYFFFARCFVAAMLYCEGDGRNRSKNFKRDITGLFVSVLLFYKSNFQQTCHLYFSTPVCFPRTRILLIMGCNQILSFPVRYLKDILWKVATNGLAFSLHSHPQLEHECWRKCLVFKVVLREFWGNH